MLKLGGTPRRRREPVMIKSELVARLAKAHPDLQRAAVERAVAAVLDAMTDALAEGGRVELRGFGAFSVRHRPAKPRPSSAAARSCARA